MNTKLVLVSFLMVLSIVFIGCKNPANPYVTDNDAGNGSEDNGDSNGNGGLPTPGTGNPLNVSVHLSTISARSVITSEGGNIQLIDPNGNTVTLNIPENAVYKEEITMTLISSLDGATLSGGILSGVDIQPDGLQLLKPGTLTIEPQDPDIISELLSVDSDYLLTTFAYRGDGSDFHYYPYRITGNKIRWTPLSRPLNEGLKPSSFSRSGCSLSA